MAADPSAITAARGEVFDATDGLAAEDLPALLSTMAEAAELRQVAHLLDRPAGTGPRVLAAR